LEATGKEKTHDEMAKVIKLSANEARMKNEFIAISCSRRKLGVTRSTLSQPEDYCFTKTSDTSRTDPTLAKSMSSAPDGHLNSFFAKSA
jgi:hypothetical protein